MNDGILIFLSLLLCYLLGSINMAVLLSRLWYHDDVRNYGSGNAGTTNMLRTYGWKAAGATFAGDVLKGTAAVWLTRVLLTVGGAENLVPHLVYLAAVVVILGHMYPIFFRFQGGKGVATGIGAAAAIHPLLFLGLCGIGFPLVFLTGYVSLASLIGASAFPILVWAEQLLFGGGKLDTTELLLAVVLALLIIYNHRTNISRLLSHTENKVKFKK